MMISSKPISIPSVSMVTLAMALSAMTLSACTCAGTEPAQGFISDDPGADGGIIGVGEDGGDGDGDAGVGELEISEADIISLAGDRLYALSSYAGLTVVDLSKPDQLRSLGTWETDAEPFEMYVEGDQVFVMFNDYGFWEWDVGFDAWAYSSSSRLIALDVRDPADIEVSGEFTLSGRIQDSRRVGDMLYVVTLEDGDCWGCDGEQKTVVTSLDIRDEARPKRVAQLEFGAAGPSWDWQRSVASTSERMYVAAHGWSWLGQGSFIDVIDISAGDGSLVAGAKIEVAGDVFSRWQIDEYQGVLRVISQLGGGDAPMIETFTVESAQSIVPLGAGSLSLPKPESLRSVRFDGLRAYAITAEQSDPLFTIDLSDPAAPKQVGALEIPGWVYHMETRGDRVLGLGYDPGNPAGSLNLSLFDVSTLERPKLRRRVHFGGDWASFAEVQDRIHKAFTILDDEQMILVPHSGWSDEDSVDCGDNFRSGVQIIDWINDDLSLRGLAPTRGQARRAFTHAQRIMAVSDVELASFDYADRDAPAAKDALTLAVNVDDLVHVGELWVRVARDWWTGEQRLELVDGDDPGAPEPLGVIELAALGGCERGEVEELFAIGEELFVVQSVEASGAPAADASGAARVRVSALDVSDPAAPILDDRIELPGAPARGVSEVAKIATQSSWIVQQGEALALLVRMDDGQGADPVRLQVLDLSDPRALERRATLERPAGQSEGQLALLSDTIVSWHTEPVEEELGKVRFYLDRLNLSGPVPAWDDKINVPGLIVAYDAKARRAFTVDFHLEQVQMRISECHAHAKYWSFEREGASEVGTCSLMSRTLERLELSGSQAARRQTIDIEGEGALVQLHVSAARIFAKTQQSRWDADAPLHHEGTALIVVDASNNSGARHELDGDPLGRWWWIMAVDGSRALIRSNDNSLVLVDATVLAHPTVERAALPGRAGCYNPVIDEDTVYCPMGPYGLEIVEW